MKNLSASPDPSLEALVGRIADDFTQRLNRGEAPDVEDYARRHPEVAGLLRDVLPGLRLIRLPLESAVTAGDAVTPLPPGTGCLGDYRLLREVGRGGMGVVYEAEQISLGRRVALKVLPFAAALDPKQLQRFKNEAQAAAHLHYQGIVPVYAVGCERGVHYYAMQFIEGQTLADVIAELREQAGADAPADQGPPDPDRTGAYTPAPAGPEDRAAAATPPAAALSTARSTRDRAFFQTAARLGLQAAEALEHAHQFGVIHRDIKPANLLVDVRGQLWVADFGLARLHGDAGLTMTGDLIGTIRYMSPEQALAKRVLVDHRTDVYSLGVTLYELLTLRPPFAGADRQEVLRQIAFDEPQALRRVNAAVPAELEIIVLKAMAKSPDERYATAQELADDLGRFLRDEPIRARRPSLWQRARKLGRRHKAVVVTAGLALALALVAAVVGLLINNRLVRAEEGRTRQALTKAEVLLADMNLASGEVAGDRNEPAVASLWFANAARVAPADPDRQRANLTRFRNCVRMAPVPLAAVRHPGERVAAIAFHPHGRSLMVLTEKRCTLVGLPHGEEEPLPGGDRPVTAAAWSPDGTHLALATPGGDVGVYRLAGGARVQHFRHRGPVRVAAYSRDGRSLAVAGRTARVWDCRTATFATPEIPHPAPVLRLVFNGRGDRLATACADGNARVFAVPPGPRGAGPLFAPLPNRAPAPPGNLPVDPVFVASDRGLLTLGFSGIVHWWDAETGREVRQIVSQWGYSFTAASPDGKHLVVAGLSSGGRLWQVNPARAVGQKFAHGNHIYAAAFSPDGQVLLTVGADRTARLWDVPGGTALYSTLAHQNDVKFAAFAPDGQLFATGQDDGLVRVWAIPRGFVRPRQMVIDGERLSARMSPDGRHVILCGNKWGHPRRTRVHAAATGEPAGPYLEADGPVMAAVLCPDGRTAVTAASTAPDPNWPAEVAPSGEGGRVRFWDWRSGRPLGDPVALPAHPWDLACSPDGAVVAATCHGGQIVLIDRATRRVLARPDPGPPEKADYRFPGVRFTPDGRGFVTWGTDGAVRVWQVPSGAPRYPPLRHGGQTLDATPSADGRWLVTGARDNAARVWDLATGRPQAAPLPHPDYVFSACFSPDGERVLTACRDGAARVWDWRSGRLLCPPLRFGVEAWMAAFTPDGRTIIAGAGGAVRLWDGRTGRAITPPYNIGGSDRRMLVTPDGRHAVVAGFALAITVLDLGELTGPGDVRPDEAVTLGEIVCGQRLFEGALAGLTTAEWMDRWRTWRANGSGRETVSPLPPRDWHQGQANACEVNRRWAGAVWHLERLTALDPGNAELWVRLGRARREAGRHAAAVAALDEAIRLDPASAYAFSQRGLAHRATGANDRAIADATEAIRLTPWDGWPYLERSFIRLRLGDHDGAIADATKALRLMPTRPEVWGTRAQAYMGKGEHDKAIADLTEAIRLNPNHGLAYSHRAMLYYTHKGDMDRAVADYSTVIRLNSQDAAAFFNRGLAYEVKGDDDRAIADFSRAIELPYAGRATAYVHRGRAYARKGDRDRALADLTEAVRLNPRDARGYASRGEAHALREEYEEALADYAEAIRLDPRTARHYMCRAGIYSTMAEFDRAIADYGEAIRLNPRDGGAYNNRSLAFASKYDCGRAIADCDQAIRLSPGVPLFWYNRGRYRLTVGDDDRAVTDLSEAIRLKPGFAAAIIRRGCAYASRQEWDRALADFKEAARLNPTDLQPLTWTCFVWLGRHREEDYRRACSLLLARAGKVKAPLAANDAAWVCLLSPAAKVEPARLVKLAERGWLKEPKNANYLNTLGAALVRAGRYEEAVRRLEDAIQFGDGKGTWADWLVLALAHHHLGHPAEARRWLAKAVAWWDGAGKDGPKDEHGLPPDWSARVGFRVLRAEAEALLKPDKP